MAPQNKLVNFGEPNQGLRQTIATETDEALGNHEATEIEEESALVHDEASCLIYFNLPRGENLHSDPWYSTRSRQDT